MADIGTSTVAYATRQTTGQLVFIASDGAAAILWCDGTNQVIAYDDSTYASWTKVTHTTGLNMVLAGDFRSGTDNIDTATGGTANVRGNYRLLTKSGATWTVGASNGLSGTTAIGVTAQGSPCVYAGQDAQGRHWIVVPGATNTVTTCYYSAANSPTTTGWTASGGVTQTADLFTPAADQVGNYLVYIYWNGTALQWKRVDNSAASVGSWTTAATITGLTGSPNASSAVKFKAISATQGLLTYSSGSGIYAQLYTASGDTWGAATQLSSGANDRHPTIAVDGTGKAWVVWCSYVASNNFALLYKKYNGSTWDAGATTLVASGTNINYPNAGFGAKTIGVTYTQGTGSPYTVGWVTIPLGGSRAITGITAALSGPTPYILYGSDDSYGAPLSTAAKLATTTGGSEIAKSGTISTGSGIYTELWSQGGNIDAPVSIPATPTGHGWLWPVPGAGSFGTQNWDAHVAYATSNTGVTGTQTVRFFKYSGGIYTLIKSLVSGNFSTPSGRNVPTLTPGGTTATDFAAGDYLYMDAWVSDSTYPTSSTITTYVSTDVTAGGVTNDAQFTTAFWTLTVSGVTYTRDITSVSVALQALDIEHPISGVTVATKALGIEKPLSGVSASVSVPTTTYTRPITGVSVATQALGLTRPIVGVTGATQALGLTRPVVGVSGAMKALGLTRPVVGVTSALQALGLTRPVVGVTASVTVPSAYQTAILAKTPLHYYRLGEVSGLAALDIGSSPQNGTISATGITYGQSGAISGDTDTALGFNGSSGVIDLAANTLPASCTAFTLEAWVYNAGNTGLGGIIECDKFPDYVNIQVDNGGIRFELTDGTGSTYYYPYTTLNTWVYVAATLSAGGAIEYYIDGSPIHSASIGASGLTFDHWSIGHWDTYLSGKIDEAAIYSYALSSTEIADNYAIGKGVRTYTRPISGVSAATLQPGITRPITNVTASASVAYSRSIVGVSAATLQPGITRPIVGLSASLSVTYTRPMTGISSALQAFGVPRNISSVSAAVGVGGIQRTITGVTAATKQLGATRPIIGVSVATMQVGLTRPLVVISASVVLTASRSISGVSTALKALGVERPVVSVSAATKALGVSRPIAGVTGAVGQGGISRSILNVSVALQAFGVSRNVTGVSSAVQAFGVTRPIVGVSGAVKQIGLTRDISGVSVALAQTVSRTVIGVTSAVQALSLPRPMINVSTSVTLRAGKTVIGISSAVKALGVPRTITGILGAIGVAGITRPLTGISASLSFSGKMYTYVTVVGARGNVTVEGTRGNVTVEGARGTITVQEE